MSFFSAIASLFKRKDPQPNFQQGWHKDAVIDHVPGGRELDPRFLVIHFTAGATGRSSIAWWRKQGGRLSAHFVIERDGEVIQCKPCNRTANHAGPSEWQCPLNGRVYHNLNSLSIGIELANGGSTYPDNFTDELPVVARHKFQTRAKSWEAYPDAQLQACAKLAKDLVEEYQLTDVVGHEDIAPNRKDDPGPACPM